MKKGFLHIVEIIIVSLLMFLVISQFSFIPRVQSDWSQSKLYLMGSDLIAMLDINETNWLDEEEVKTKIINVDLNEHRIGLSIKAGKPKGSGAEGKGSGAVWVLPAGSSLRCAFARRNRMGS